MCKLYIRGTKAEDQGKGLERWLSHPTSHIIYMIYIYDIYNIPCIFQNNFNQHLPIKYRNFLKAASTMKRIKYCSTSKSPTRRHLLPLPKDLKSRWYHLLISFRTAPQQVSCQIRTAFPKVLPIIKRAFTGDIFRLWSNDNTD